MEPFIDWIKQISICFQDIEKHWPQYSTRSNKISFYTVLYAKHMLVYCYVMGNPEKKATRVTRDDWLKIALEVLAEDGIHGISVDTLAVHLGVTRGSFYHHFKDRDELSHEMLSFWANKWTTEIRDDVAALNMDGFNSLRALGQLIRHRQAAAYDVAVRSWALHDSMAQKFVAEVDTIRLDFIRSLFQKIGFEGLDLENRSRLYLYYVMTEPAFFAPPDDEDAIHLADIRLEFLTARTVTGGEA
jgi:AcrR family transcriptional regulator